MPQSQTEQVYGIAWHRREQWPLLKGEAVDSAALENTYGEWLRIAQETLINLANSGVRAERVDVDVNDLVAWCRSQGRRLDSAARAEFVARTLRGQHEQGLKDTA